MALTKIQFAEHLGSAMKTVRNAKGWSVEEAARAIGMSASQLYHYESGNRSPSMEVFCRILNGLGCRSEELLGEFLEKP